MSEEGCICGGDGGRQAEGKENIADERAMCEQSGIAQSSELARYCVQHVGCAKVVKLVDDRPG